jgi:hypothetical protein
VSGQVANRQHAMLLRYFQIEQTTWHDWGLCSNTQNPSSLSLESDPVRVMPSING